VDKILLYFPPPQEDDPLRSEYGAVSHEAVERLISHFAGMWGIIAKKVERVFSNDPFDLAKHFQEGETSYPKQRLNSCYENVYFGNRLSYNVHGRAKEEEGMLLRNSS
jgi:hypothetical protein